MSVEITKEQLVQFCTEWLKTDDPFVAATAVFTGNPGLAARASRELILEPKVVKLRQALLDKHGAEHFLPTKIELARKIIRESDIARNSEDKTKLYKLYAEIMGFVEKPKTGPELTIRAPKVMLVQNKGTDKEWEDAVGKQQRKLRKGT